VSKQGSRKKGGRYELYRMVRVWVYLLVPFTRQGILVRHSSEVFWQDILARHSGETFC
jgi:hypothetical protein